MGVKGLLQALKCVTKESHLIEFAGKKVGIDGYGWLHKAAFTAVEELSNGHVSDKPTWYCMKRLLRLKHDYKITPLVVVDGRPLPSKARTNASRHLTRELNKEKGRQLAEQGDTNGAHKAFSQAISISWAMVEHFLECLTRENIEFIVAPYEADAQLGYLSRINYVDLVISEDSDLILYGCKRVCYKLNDTGQCRIIESVDLPRANLLPQTLYDHDSLIILSTMSGCDYTEGIRGLGIKKASRQLASTLVREISHNDFEGGGEALTPLTRIDKIATDLGVSSGVDLDKVKELKKAYLTFKYQTVWDPVKVGQGMLFYHSQQQCVRSHALPDRYNEEEYLGPILDPKTMRLLCTGRIEPKSLKPSRLANLEIPPALNAHKLNKFRTPPANESREPSSKIASSITSFFKVSSPKNYPINRRTGGLHKQLMIKPRSKTINLQSDEDEENKGPLRNEPLTHLSLKEAVAPLGSSDLSTTRISPEIDSACFEVDNNKEDAIDSSFLVRKNESKKRSLGSLFVDSMHSRKQKALRHFQSEKISFS